VIDVLVLIPYFLRLAVELTAEGSTPTAFAEFLDFGPMQSIMTSQPIFRLLKVARNFGSFRLLVKSLGQSFRSLVVPFYLLFFLAVFFGTLFYWFEHQTNPNVFSIPDSVWWAVVTIATVGYGDIYPITNSGMWVTSALIFVSILFVAMPLSIVGSNYVQIWLDRNKLLLIERMQSRMRILKLGPQDARYAFSMYKTNSEGGLSLKEFTEMTIDLKLKLTPDEQIESFEALDPGNLKEVVFAQFAKQLFPDKIWTDAELNIETKGDEGFRRASSADDLSEEDIRILVTSIIKERLAALEMKADALNLVKLAN